MTFELIVVVVIGAMVGIGVIWLLGMMLLSLIGEAWLNFCEWAGRRQRRISNRQLNAHRITPKFNASGDLE